MAARRREEKPRAPHHGRPSDMATPFIGRLDRYLAGEIARPFALTLLIAALLLVLERLLRLLDMIVQSQGAPDMVWRMLAALLPHYVGLALPLGLFIGTLAAFRRLSLSSELDALFAAGIAPGRLLRPVYAMTLAVVAVSILLTAYIQPLARYTFNRLAFEATGQALGGGLTPGRFYTLPDGVTLFARGIGADGGMRGVFLHRPSQGERPAQTLTAARGQLLADPGGSRVVLDLAEGRMLRPAGDPPGAAGFERAEIPLFDSGLAAFRSRGALPREMTLRELAQTLAGAVPERVPGHMIAEVRAALHWRILYVLTFLPLPLLAVAVGPVAKRRAGLVRALVGLVIVIAYHEALQTGQSATRDGASPWLTMWPVFAGLCAIAGAFYARWRVVPR
ncbi:hypothetical protein CCR80_02140 [Rhodothalassium salexigens]|nr:hypothetical protein [Rhodothalassium salexigens]